MELKDLYSFVAVAEELHFGRAAGRLHISAPPLTQRIKALERKLDVQLFVRTKRSVSITPAGVALLAEARRLLLQVHDLPEHVQRVARGEMGYLRAGVVGAALYSNLVADIVRSIPDVHLVWHVLGSADQVQRIRENRLDLGLINTPIDHDGVLVQLAHREPLVVVMPATHRYANRRSIALRLLKSEVFIMGERHLAPSYYDQVIGACNAGGFSPKINHQAQSIATFMGLIALGVGVSLVPASMAKAGVGGVSYVSIQGQAPLSEISIAWNPLNPSPLLARTLELLKAGLPYPHKRRRGTRRLPRTAS